MTKASATIRLEDSPRGQDAASPDVTQTPQLAAGQNEPGQGGLELALVIILGLTALASTWCAYQSQRWNGTQLALLVDADMEMQKAHEGTLAGMSWRNLDALVFLHFMDAKQRNDTQMADAMLRRMRSPMHEAVEAWLKLDPLNNPAAPHHPGLMPQYVLVEEQQAKSAREKALQVRAAAQEAGQNGDTYTLLTLLFASVLFFGGITGTFHSRRTRLGLSGIALVLFLGTVVALTTMPVCRG